MLLTLVIRLIAVAAAFAFTAWLVPEFDVNGGAFSYLWLAFVFGLVNAIVGPILRLISLPLTMVTLGLFGLVVNGILIAIVARLTSALDVGSFGWTILGAVALGSAAAVFVPIATRLVPGATATRR